MLLLVNLTSAEDFGLFFSLLMVLVVVVEHLTFEEELVLVANLDDIVAVDVTTRFSSLPGDER